ncbi:MAG: hypothetical protein ACLP36_15290 [Acidimicrobiales bacterium]
MSEDEAGDYGSWIDNGRRLRELESLGAATLEADERTSRRS